MMTKICTDVEQSNKLIEFGIDVNTADMCYHFIEINKTPLCIRWEKVHDDEKDNSIPCWSLAALLDVLKDYTLQTNTDGTVFVVCDGKKPIISDFYNNPVDACVDMIEKLHKLNLF